MATWLAANKSKAIAVTVRKQDAGAQRRLLERYVMAALSTTPTRQKASSAKLVVMVLHDLLGLKCLESEGTGWSPRGVSAGGWCFIQLCLMLGLKCSLRSTVTP